MISQLEAAYLSAVVLLRDDAYGGAILEKAREIAAPVKLSYGSLYTTLERLERKGFLRSTVAERTPERGGRAPRYFQLTALGEQALKQAQAFARSIDASLRPAWGWKS